MGLSFLREEEARRQWSTGSDGERSLRSGGLGRALRLLNQIKSEIFGCRLEPGGLPRCEASYRGATALTVAIGKLGNLGNQICLSPLELCHCLPSLGVYSDGTEETFRRRYFAIAA